MPKASYLLVIIYILENMFASYVFPDKYQTVIAYVSHANYQASGGHFLTNFW